MNFDFATVMVVAVFVTGTIWALDAIYFAPRRRPTAAGPGHAPSGPQDNRGNNAAREPLIVEYSKAFFPVILIVLLLRSFLVEPFRIPSGSMMPTLLAGDFILVNKFVYGIRLPVINKKVFDIDAPKRGDVVVFRFPNDPSIDYIKRVVGLPGDRIGYFNKIIYVNGDPMAQHLDGTYKGAGAGIAMTGASLRTERLGMIEHQILIRSGQPSVEGEFQVPAGHFFVMGDNRDNSNDSRYWGFVPEQNLVGKAFLIWMSWDGMNGGVMWDRLGSSVK